MNKLCIVVIAVASAVGVVPRARAQDAATVLSARASTPVLLMACAEAASWPGGAASRWLHPAVVARGMDAEALWGQCVAGELPFEAASDGGDDMDRIARYRAWREGLASATPLAMRAERACQALPREEVASFTADPVGSTRSAEVAQALRRADTAISYCVGDRAQAVPSPGVIERLERVASLLGEPSSDDLRTRIADSGIFDEPLGSAPEEPADPGEDGGAPSSPEELAMVILGGLADFLVGRAEQEVQAFVITRIRDELCTPDGSEGDSERLAAAYLSNTCAFLGGDDFRFAAVLGAGFRSAVMADVLAIPSVALRELRLPLPTAGTARRDGPWNADDQAASLRVGLALVHALLHGSDPRTVLDLFMREVGSTAAVPDRVRVILRAVAAAVSAGLLENRVPEAREILAMLALVRPPNAADLDWDYRSTALAQHVVQWATAVRTLSERGREAPPRRTESGSTQDPVGDTSRETASEDEEHEGPTDILRAAANAMGAALLVVEDVIALSGAMMELPPWVRSTLEALLSGDPGRMVAAGLRVIQEVTAASDIHAPVGVVRIVGLGAELAMAETREDVSEVLDQFAAPVGSWRAKTDHLTVSLNGMLGLSGGFEVAPGAGNRTTATGGYGGLIGLVGVDVAGPHGGPTGPSLGAFFSLLDVGALVTFGSATPVQCSMPASGDSCPMGSTQTTTDPDEVSPLQFVAPGAFFRVGLRDVPFVFGIGGSVLPWGRTVRWDDQSEMIPIVRIGVFAAVDITILPL